MYNPFKPIVNFFHREFLGPNTKKVEKNWESIKRVMEWSAIIYIIYIASEPINPELYELKKYLEQSERYVGMQLSNVVNQEFEKIEMENRAMGF
ncbi:hypothetical protein C9374_014618 [Naegleria lovaniensis]|uniref:Uncharacterized protein n=1 Tax=Naegleria lovaniensis TaxID=51637 RepID=A0AA88H1A2_NAELO|nr:uncharacterized protein C9374_014618 [Naegleria lovaniensis]KAG2389218.1 hypothetical protein C9374_014618 [Naegleria lovaniensis]